jgi:hypothetical protein
MNSGVDGAAGATMRLAIAPGRESAGGFDSQAMFDRTSFLADGTFQLLAPLPSRFIYIDDNSLK